MTDESSITTNAGRSMRALTIHGRCDARIDHIALPAPSTGCVRLRMAYAGICGSDLHYFYEAANGSFVLREPLVPGHELSGTVDLDPSGELSPGAPVTVSPATFGVAEAGIEDRPQLWPGGAYLGSASTWPHTHGGMSEYLVVRRDMIRLLPPTLPLRRGALAEPLAVGLHAIGLAGGVQGKRVLVSGAGPIGLLAAAAALARGAVEVTVSDVLAGPLERARALDVTRTVQVGTDSQELPENTFDLVLECSGAPPAISAALTVVRRAGVVVQIGMVADGAQPVALAPLIAKEIQLIGSFRFHDEIDNAVQLLASSASFETVITHVLPADDAAAAFAFARDSETSGKVLVDLWNEG